MPATRCPNCMEADLIPVRLVSKETDQPISDADYCPACGCLQETS
jgi:hypothetical protein